MEGGVGRASWKRELGLGVELSCWLIFFLEVGLSSCGERFAGASLGWWKGMALFVLLGALVWLFFPVVVFVLLGPGAQPSSLLVRFLFLLWGLEKRELGQRVELSFWLIFFLEVGLSSCGGRWGGASLGWCKGMALFVLLGALFWVQELCLGLVILFQFLFLFCWVLGPSCPLWFSFPPQPSLCQGFRRGRVRVDRGGGLEKGSLAGEVGGEGGFVFLLFKFFCLFLFCCCVFGFVFVLFFVLLEWSRCCSCFEPIPLEWQHQQKGIFEGNRRGRRHIWPHIEKEIDRERERESERERYIERERRETGEREREREREIDREREKWAR